MSGFEPARRPAALVLERLNFQNPALSRRLNRIIQNCGRAVIRAKLADPQDRFGIASEAAYTSQICPCCSYRTPIAGHLPVLVVRLSNARRGQCGAEHRGAPCAPYRFRVPVEGGDPRGTGAPVQRAKGVQHPIRWEGFHRRPASDQSLLRCGKASRGSDVKKGEATTRFGGCLDNSIVSSLCRNCVKSNIFKTRSIEYKA